MEVMCYLKAKRNKTMKKHFILRRVLAKFGNLGFSDYFSIQIALSQKQKVGRK